VQFRQQVGPLMVTVFSAPVPLRVGSADFSVLVQTVRDASPLLNAEVALQLSGAGTSEIRLPATRTQATNKLLYAAHPVLPSPGQWWLTVQVKSNGQTLDVHGKITVLPHEAAWIAYWPYVVPVPVGVLVFLVNQRLRRRRV
jgi:hypothetical protein